MIQIPMIVDKHRDKKDSMSNNTQHLTSWRNLDFYGDSPIYNVLQKAALFSKWHLSIFKLDRHFNATKWTASRELLYSGDNPIKWFWFLKDEKFVTIFSWSGHLSKKWNNKREHSKIGNELMTNFAFLDSNFFYRIVSWNAMKLNYNVLL